MGQKGAHFCPSYSVEINGYFMGKKVQSEDNKAKADRTVALFKELEADRNTLQSHWSDLADYISPRRGTFDWSESQEGGKYQIKHYDDTAIRAARIFSDGLLGHCAPQHTKWFKMVFENKEVDGNDIAKEWLQATENLFTTLLDKGNFYDSLSEMSNDGVTFGTASMWVNPDQKKTKITFKTRHLREIFIKCNDDGDVSTTIRKYRLTAHEAIKKFGEDAFYDDWVKAAKEDPFKKFFFLHAIFPRDNVLLGKIDAKNMPWASIHILQDESRLLKESGYRVPPGITWRFRTNSGEDYGSSNSWDVEASILTINQMKKGLIELGQKISQPPLNVPGDSIDEVKANYEPNGMIPFTRASHKTEPLVLGQNYPINKDLIDGTKADINEAFYVNFWVALMASAGEKMTATQVNEMGGEKAAILGSIVSRLNTEVFSHVFNRMFQICFDLGWLPPVDEEIEQYIRSGLKIEYIGPLPMALKRYNNTHGTTVAVQQILSFGEFLPGMMDHIDEDELSKSILRSHGADEKVIRNKNDVLKLRKERAERQEKAEKQQQLLMEADIAGKTSKKMEDGSPAKMVLDKQ